VCLSRRVSWQRDDGHDRHQDPPAAEIERGLFMNHGAGIVIGGTAGRATT
jgi:hypothetical protein